ncbi:retrotransposon polyprotein, putative [Rhizophagus irregularis DAOM 181602=DAOM 197198]|nr:retrotransposon polyprotein, putative [Rhizophagus irregularis DAOM 181602=DAOM 197198]
MFDKIQSRYYWPQMYNDIRSYVMSCDSCQRRGKQKTKLPLHPIPVETMDYLTKWPEARPVKHRSNEKKSDFDPFKIVLPILAYTCRFFAYLYIDLPIYADF